MPQTARLPVQEPSRPGLLEPRSIAVIGASDQPGNLGGRIISFLQKFDFKGSIWSVNPRRETVAGMRCYPTAKDLPETPDLAVIAVSAGLALEAVRGCIEGGIRNGIVLAGGFAEVGEEGEAMQEELTALCKANDFQLCGPNTLGIINTWLPMTASFGSHLIDLPALRAGDISIVSQSGGTAAVVHALAERAGFGLRYLISAGNEAILNVADYLRLVADDPNTRVVGMYLEGTRDGDDFLDALGKVRASGKPVVMLKAGVAEVSARAAAAHTGSLAGEARIWDTVLREYGVIRVTTLVELLDALLSLSALGGNPLPAGQKVAIVSLDEGTAAITRDLCIREGLEVVHQSVPLLASQADNSGTLFQTAARNADLVFVDGAMADLAPGPMLDTLVASLSDFRKRGQTPLFVSLPADGVVSAQLAEKGIYAFPDPSRAVETIGRLVNGGSNVAWAARKRPAPIAFDWSKTVGDCTDGTVISEHDCHSILAAAGLDVAAGQLAVTRQEAVSAAAAVRYPVAMKGISPAVTHRAAAGLLALNVASDIDAADAHDRLTARAAEIDVTLDGIYIQHMERGEKEVIVSALRDPVFGIVVTCGAGGTATELIDDVTIERAPVDVDTARAMIKRLRMVESALDSDPGLDLDQLAGFVSHFSRLAASAPWSRFAFEVNPVKWRPDRAVAVDGLLVIDAC